MGLMGAVSRFGKLAGLATGNPMALGADDSPFQRLMKTGQGVARIATGDVAGGAAQIGGALAKKGSPLAGLSEAYQVGAGLMGGGGPAGLRGAEGQANLGVNTDLGYGQAPSYEMPAIGAGVNRIGAPGLQGAFARRFNGY